MVAGGEGPKKTDNGNGNVVCTPPAVAMPSTVPPRAREALEVLGVGQCLPPTAETQARLSTCEKALKLIGMKDQDAQNQCVALRGLIAGKIPNPTEREKLEADLKKKRATCELGNVKLLSEYGVEFPEKAFYDLVEDKVIKKTDFHLTYGENEVCAKVHGSKADRVARRMIDEKCLPSRKKREDTKGKEKCDLLASAYPTILEKTWQLITENPIAVIVGGLFSVFLFSGAPQGIGNGIWRGVRKIFGKPPNVGGGPSGQQPPVRPPAQPWGPQQQRPLGPAQPSQPLGPAQPYRPLGPAQPSQPLGPAQPYRPLGPAQPPAPPMGPPSGPPPVQPSAPPMQPPLPPAPPASPPVAPPSPPAQPPLPPLPPPMQPPPGSPPSAPPAAPSGGGGSASPGSGNASSGTGSNSSSRTITVDRQAAARTGMLVTVGAGLLLAGKAILAAGAAAANTAGAMMGLFMVGNGGMCYDPKTERQTVCSRGDIV